MLEWLEVRFDVGCDKRLVYEYHIELLNCDRDALKQECYVTCITYITHLIYFYYYFYALVLHSQGLKISKCMSGDTFTMGTRKL